jgi:hypothetical protein
LRDVIVPETHFCDATTTQPGAPSFISNLMLGFAVLAAIKLDWEAQLRTVEVEHVGASGILPPEAQSIQPAAFEVAP